MPARRSNGLRADDPTRPEQHLLVAVRAGVDDAARRGQFGHASRRPHELVSRGLQRGHSSVSSDQSLSARRAVRLLRSGPRMEGRRLKRRKVEGGNLEVSALVTGPTIAPDQRTALCRSVRVEVYRSSHTQWRGATADRIGEDDKPRNGRLDCVRNFKLLKCFWLLECRGRHIIRSRSPGRKAGKLPPGPAQISHLLPGCKTGHPLGQAIFDSEGLRHRNSGTHASPSAHRQVRRRRISVTVAALRQLARAQPLVEQGDTKRNLNAGRLRGK